MKHRYKPSIKEASGMHMMMHMITIFEVDTLKSRQRLIVIEKRYSVSTTKRIARELDAIIAEREIAMTKNVLADFERV